MTFNVTRRLQGSAPVAVYSFDRRGSDDPQKDAESLCAILNRLAADSLCCYVVEEENSDEADFFAPAPEPRTLFQEGVCRPGWVQPIPELPAAPLYMPNA